MRLLEAIVGVAAAIGEGDDVRAGPLRLQQERGEVGGVERVAHRAENLAAGGGDRGGAIGLHVLAEAVVGGDEEPGLAAGLGQRPAERRSRGIGVVGPVDEVLRAFRPGQSRRAGAGADRRLVLFLGDRQHGEGDRGVRQVHDDVDVLGVEPAPRDRRSDVGLVLVIGRDDLDRDAELGGEVFGRELRRDHRPHPLIVGIDARHVVEDADLERLHALGEPDPRRCDQRRSRKTKAPAIRRPDMRQGFLPYGCCGRREDRAAAPAAIVVEGPLRSNRIGDDRDDPVAPPVPSGSPAARLPRSRSARRRSPPRAPDEKGRRLGPALHAFPSARRGAQPAAFWTGPESLPLASRSRSTNSITAMAALSPGRKPAFMMRR